MPNVFRFHTRPLDGDPRAARLVADAHALGIAALQSVAVVDLMFVLGDLDDEACDRLAAGLLAAPLLASAGRHDGSVDGLQVIETARLPGVTDSVASELVRAARLLGLRVDAAATGTRYELGGVLSADDVDHLARRLLANGVVERYAFGAVTPSFPSAAKASDSVVVVAIRDLDGDGLARLDAERGLALDPTEQVVIRDWFRAEGRDPTDVELETLAQTWSEHCAHKTFRAAITDGDGTVITPLFTQLRMATETIAAPWVVSAFVGNAGIIGFTPEHTLAVKVETHNHPSAIEPFGGANTGVGGVIRDVLGTSHKPIAATDVLCFGPLDVDPATLPDGVLHPRRIRSGVVAGVADYGNKIGLPTVAGAVLYDAGFTANPLVFRGCVGLARRDAPPAPGPLPGDRVVVIGGRTGRDGLRGATFSSMTMDATTGEVAGASVQIGDPITEKLLIDVLDDAGGLYRGITDCGAGGLSSAIGEMAEGVGAEVDLALVPLKYPGLAPWEVWLSEAQERMVLAVPDVSALKTVCDAHGVELADIGTFTGDGRLVVRHAERIVLDLDTAFLHDGRPQRNLVAHRRAPQRTTDRAVAIADEAATLLALLGDPNIASVEDVIRTYDHEIGGGTVVRPLTGAADDGPADGVVLTRPDLTAGVAIGIGVNPWYGTLDPERMGEAVVDEAIRNVVAVGADPDHVALLDNFSWGDPRRPETLGDLVAAVEGICRAAVAHRAPFVSGKDSLNNEYLGRDGQRHAVPPTLVITAFGVVPDAGRAVTPDLKESGNVLVLLGATHGVLGGSRLTGPPTAGVVPAHDADAPARYRSLFAAINAGFVRSCHDVGYGGVAVALAEMVIGGRLGAQVQLPSGDRSAVLFGEACGRFVVEVAPSDLDAFTATIGAHTVLGRVTDDGALHVDDTIHLDRERLTAAFFGGAR